MATARDIFKPVKQTQAAAPKLGTSLEKDIKQQNPTPTAVTGTAITQPARDAIKNVFQPVKAAPIGQPGSLSARAIAEGQKKGEDWTNATAQQKAYNDTYWHTLDDPKHSKMYFGMEDLRKNYGDENWFDTYKSQYKAGQDYLNKELDKYKKRYGENSNAFKALQQFANDYEDAARWTASGAGSYQSKAYSDQLDQNIKEIYGGLMAKPDFAAKAAEGKAKLAKSPLNLYETFDVDYENATDLQKSLIDYLYATEGKAGVRQFLASGLGELLTMSSAYKLYSETIDKDDKAFRGGNIGAQDIVQGIMDIPQNTYRLVQDIFGTSEDDPTDKNLGGGYKISEATDYYLQNTMAKDLEEAGITGAQFNYVVEQGGLALKELGSDWAKEALANASDFQKQVLSFMLLASGEEAAKATWDGIKEYEQLVWDATKKGSRRLATSVDEMLNPMYGEYLNYGGKELPSYFANVGGGTGATVEQMLFQGARSAANQLIPMAMSMGVGGLFKAAGATTKAVNAAARVAGAAPMATMIGGQAYDEAKEAGASRGKALGYAITEAGLEFLTDEMLGRFGAFTGRLTGGLRDKVVSNIASPLLRALTDMGIGSFSEGVQEYVQEALEPMISDIFLDEGNWKDTFDPDKILDPDRLYAGFLGSLTALMMSPGAAVKGIKSNRFYSAWGKAMDAPTLAKTVDIILNSNLTEKTAADAEAFEAAQKTAQLIKNGTKVSNLAAGKMVVDFMDAGGDLSHLRHLDTQGYNKDALTVEDMAAGARARLAELHGNVDLAQDLARYATGEQVTAEFMQALKDDPIAAQVFSELTGELDMENDKNALTIAARSTTRNNTGNKDYDTLKAENTTQTVASPAATTLFKAGVEFEEAQQIGAVIEKVANGQTITEDEAELIPVANSAMRQILSDTLGITIAEDATIGTVLQEMNNAAATMAETRSMQQEVANTAKQAAQARMPIPPNQQVDTTGTISIAGVEMNHDQFIENFMQKPGATLEQAEKAWANGRTVSAALNGEENTNGRRSPIPSNPERRNQPVAAGGTVQEGTERGAEAGGTAVSQSAGQSGQSAGTVRGADAARGYSQEQVITEYDAEQREFMQTAKDDGFTSVILINGPLANRNGQEINAKVDKNGALTIRWDNPYADPRKVEQHEKIHLWLASLGNGRAEFVRNALDDIFDGDTEAAIAVFSAYKEAYAEAYADFSEQEFVDAIREEMLCDMYAGMDNYGVEASQFQEAAETYIGMSDLESQFHGEEAEDDNGRFSVAITGPNGETVGTLNYDDDVSPNRIANDIRHYRETGELRQSGPNAPYERWKRAASAGQEIGLTVDRKTQSAAPDGFRFSLSTWKKSDYVTARDQAARELAEVLDISLSKAKAYIDSVNSVAKAIADDATRLDYVASPGVSSLVGNTEYGGSIDFSTICKKRRRITGTFTAIQRALPNTALTAEEVLTIRKMMDERGYEVNCGLCYVEGSRAKMGEYAKQFLEEYAKTNPEYLPNMAEINTPEGIEQIRIEHPDIYAAYEKFMNKLAQRKPKLYQMATAYDGEILKKFGDNKKQVEKYNRNGGLRLQSFSDFEIIHLLDNMQVIMDMARVGLFGQAYTKVPEFAWAMGATGLKINLSLIAKGVDKNGKLLLDEKEGMKRADVEALRNAYPDTVGSIVVVFNNEQLLAAMSDPFIDYIIPFHRSQWNQKLYELMGLPEGAKDFTMWQNESYIEPVYSKSGKPQRPPNYMPNTYWDYNKTGKENAETYLQMCAANNRVPKFSFLLDDNGDGSYSLKADGSTDGYWKLLIDFKMYDNDGKGVPQRAVEPIFNEGPESDPRTVLGMLKAYEGGHQNFPVAEDVVEDFLRDYRSEHPDERYSVADNSRILSDEEFDALKQQAHEAGAGWTNAMRTRQEIQNSEEAKAWVDKIRTNYSPETIAEYKAWEESSGLAEAARQERDFDTQYRELNKQVETARKVRGTARVQKAAEEAGLSLPDYYRKLAEKEFGYTPYFYDAGYIVPNGKMLNFSGDKGKHHGVRGQDHRAIGAIFPDASGTKAMVQFMNQGNIRIMAESPGIDISTTTEPTDAQYKKIRDFIRSDVKDFFNVDFSDADGRAIANLEYDGAVRPDRVINDIKHYFQTGETRQQSTVSQFYSDRYSLAPVAAVEPKSDNWSRTHTTEEAMAVYPNLWNVAAEESEKRNPTQIASTQGTYRNIYKILQDQGFNGKILDASSGLGLGTKVGREEFGFDVEDIEPYPGEDYQPMYTDYSKLNKTYDAIISSAVLNVLPQDQRDALVAKMGELLNPGGKMYITTRGKDVDNLGKNSKNIKLGPMEYIETSRGSYQKGFTNTELKAYLEDALGPDFTVELSNKNNGGKFNNNTSIVVTKNGAAQNEAETPQERYSVMDREHNDWAPTFYSKMANTIDEWTNGKGQPLGAKMAANQVVGWLKGKGVKSEEIKWSGIVPFLEGKKTVTKEELQQVMAENEVKIETKVLGENEGYVVGKGRDRIELRNKAEIMDLALRRLKRSAKEYHYEDMIYDENGNLKEDLIQLDPHHNGSIIATDAQTGEVIVEAERISEDNTHWGDYALDGGENYREILFKQPGLDYSNRAMRTHWGSEESGTIAHARVQDMYAGRDNMLFIEEIQSDLHNEGAEIINEETRERRGFNSPGDYEKALAEREKRIAELDKWIAENRSKQRELVPKASAAKTLIYQRLYAPSFWEGQDHHQDKGVMGLMGIAYPASISRWAEGGVEYPMPSNYVEEYGKPVIDTIQKLLSPEEYQDLQETRSFLKEWNKKIKERQDLRNLPVERKPPDVPFAGEADTYHELVMKQLIRLAAESNYDKIGWTTADTQAYRWSEDYYEGYRIEYDQTLPKFMSKYVKQWGAKVGDTTLDNGVKVWSVDITPEMKDSVLNIGQPLFSVADNQNKQQKSSKKNPFPEGSAEQQMLEILKDANKAEDLQDYINKLIEKRNESIERDNRIPPSLPEKTLFPVNAKQKQVGQKQLQKLIDKYRALKKGEKPARDKSYPERTSEDRYTQRTARTAAEASAIPEYFADQIDQAVLSEALTYARITDKEALKKADADYSAAHGLRGAFKEWNEKRANTEKPSKFDIAFGQRILIEAARNNDAYTAMKVLADIATMETAAGQVVQAGRLLKKMGPVGQLYYIQKAVDRIHKENEGRIAKGTFKPIVINKQLAEAVLRANTVEEVDERMEDLIKDIASQMPVTLKDKWDAWRYLAMLGNPRTHIRNLAGNAIFAPIRFAKDLLAAAGEQFIDPSERTKNAGARLNSQKYADVREFAADDFENMQPYIVTGNKMNPLSEIMEAREIFKSPVVGKNLEKLRRWNDNLLNKEDVIFLRKAYVSAFTQFVAARGLNAEQLNGPKGGAVLNEARQYAALEAQKATYRDFSRLATALNSLRRNSGMGLLLDGLLPFTKTPINILRRGVEYSPVGLMKGAYDALFKVKRGDISAAQAIDEMAAGLTGTGVAILGYILASMGLARGADDDDKKKKALEEAEGHQSYSLEIPGVGSYTIDWMAPVALPFFVGVETHKQLVGEGEGTFWDFVNAMTLLCEPMMSLSMLDGINSTLAAVKSDQNSPIWAVLSNILASYASQGAPTLFGQVARTFDPYRRSTYVDKNIEGPALIQRTIQGIQGKTPWASKKMAYVDVWGRKDTNASWILRGLENFASPGYGNRINETPVDAELLRLYDAVGDNSVLPTTVAKNFQVEGETLNLTAKQYEEYKTVTGQTAFKLLGELIDDPIYGAMDDKQKADAVKTVLGAATAIGKKAVAPTYKTDNWIEMAIDQDNLETATIYHTLKSAGTGLSNYQLIEAMNWLTNEDRGKLVMEEHSNTGRNMTDYTKKKYKFVLTDEQIAREREIYNSLFWPAYNELIYSQKFMNADIASRANMISDMQSKLSETARRTLGDELRAAGYTSVLLDDSDVPDQVTSLYDILNRG